MGVVSSDNRTNRANQDFRLYCEMEISLVERQNSGFPKLVEFLLGILERFAADSSAFLVSCRAKAIPRSASFHMRTVSQRPRLKAIISIYTNDSCRTY